MMRVVRLALAMVAGALLAGAADAASTINSNGSITLDRTDDFSWTTNYVASAGTNLSGVTGSIVYAFTSANASGTQWNFTYSVDNTSTGNGASSRLGAFGFNASVDPSSASNVTGTFGAAINANGNFNGLGKHDVCFYSGSNCNGSGNAGVTVAAMPATGKFTLDFSQGQNTLTISDFVARFQATGVNANGSASGSGTIVTAVPEPATWAMMLFGFGMVAGTARFRRRRTHIVYA